MILVGVVLLVVGAGVAAYVGADDQVQLARHQVGPPEAPLIVSRPGLFGFRGVTLTVTAQSPGGIFVGAAPERDVARFAGGTLHFEIDRLSPSGRLTGKPVMGRRGSDATQQSFWTTQSHGPGTQRISVSLTDQATGIVVQATAPARTKGSVVGIGFERGGLFLESLAVALVGLVLLVVAAVARRRSRGRRNE
ncbi:MAG: hypothetical protein ACR2FG_02630 [Marmoricola sp.]